MNELFLDILNTSFAATWVVLAVVLLRPLFRAAPRWTVCALWALVAARLLLGGGIPSPLSKLPSAEIIPPQSLYEQSPVIHSGISIIDNTINPIYTESLRPVPGASVNPLQIWTTAFANLWILGMVIMAIWALLSWNRVRRQVRESIRDDGVYLCDRIASPFIFGLFRPKIYLPSDLSDYARPHVIAHEKAHLRRRDHWWKPLGFVLLTINWFNPAMWLAYCLLCRDIEMACDEKVVRDLNTEDKKAYSAALLRCSVNSRHITACPLAFGEVGVKQRVKSVLHYKKPAFWVILSAVVLIAVLAVRLLTSPVAEDPKQTEVPTTIAKPPSEKASDLGISTHLENITPDGATLVCTQDGSLWHEITTGANWSLQEYRDGIWIDLLPEETVWTTEAYPISTGGSRSFQLNWSQMIGSLEPGRYRIGQSFTGYEQRTLHHASKESSTQTCYAEFTIGYYENPHNYSPELYQAIQESWNAYDAMSEFDRLASSTTPGSGTREFDDWASVEQFVGQTIPNPLESLDSLEKGNWAAAPEGYNGGARFQIFFSSTRDGQVQSVRVHSGYRRGDVRIALTAQLSPDLRAQPASAYQIISDSGEAYEARTMTVYQGNVEYTLRVMGEPGTRAELISILQELIVYLE